MYLDNLSLILTATIDPKGMSYTVRANIEDRLNDYKKSFNFWINQDKVKKIIFIENSGYDISYFNDKNFLKLDTIPQAELINKIELKSKVSLSKIKPTIVAIPTIFSYHQDHIATYKASIAALRVRPQNSDFVPKTVISYESSEYSHWSPYSEIGAFSPNLYFNMSKKEITKKNNALSIYKSQLRKGHRDKNSIIKLSQIRGLEIGVDYAEAYHLHRLFF